MAKFNERSSGAYKVYIIYGVDKAFVKIYGKTIYIGFTKVFGQGRHLGCSYKDPVMQEMLAGHHVVACVAAMPFSGCGSDHKMARTLILEIEKAIYLWFDQNGDYTLLNRTLHCASCPCLFCVSVTPPPNQFNPTS